MGNDIAYNMELYRCNLSLHSIKISKKIEINIGFRKPDWNGTLREKNWKSRKINFKPL
jgi:hypothetical protein